MGFLLGAFVLILGLSILYDWWYLNNKGPIKNHKGRFWLRAGAMTANAVVFVITKKLSIWACFALVIDQSALFWLLFDIGLNLAMGWPWNHLGSTAESDANFHSWQIQYIYKLLYLAIAIVASFILI